MMLLDEYLGRGTEHGNETSYDCPFCVTRGKSPDNEEKLWVNYHKKLPNSKVPGVYFCYRCEAAGSVEYLLRWLGVDAEDTPIDEVCQRLLRWLRGEEDEQKQPPPPMDYTSELAAAGCRPIHPGSKFHRYLIDRGLDDRQIFGYRMLEGAGRYYNRVVVPTFDFEKRIPFFVGRSIKQLYFNIPGKGKVEAPKYLNPVGEGRKHSIFHLGTATKYPVVIVTEGVFSAIAAGDCAVATFGKLVTQTQIDLLVKYCRDKEIIVCLDADAHAQTVNLASKLSCLQMNVSFVALPGEHDPASMSRSEFEQLLGHRFRYSAEQVLRLQLEGTLRCQQKNSRDASAEFTKRRQRSWVELTSSYREG